MDTEWVLAQLKKFIQFTELVYTGGVVAGARRTRADDADVVAQAEVVDQILTRVMPDWRQAVPASSRYRWEQRREACIRAVAKIERQDEISKALGDDAPELSAAGMHPWVWSGARSLWQSGHFAEAVHAASMKVNAETQNRVGRRDIAETTLFIQAFNDGAASSISPRLRLPEDDGGQTANSMRRGVRMFAEGCYAAIRNPIAHEGADLSETEALERLAAFSILARWVESSTLDLGDAGDGPSDHS